MDVIEALASALRPLMQRLPRQTDQRVDGSLFYRDDYALHPSH
ncbi:MAG TPA: hypothetical protein VJ124_15280 [Pyrinomonadaceae bacterium]|nr:hypothetical protein [Pyrinomonadaceae bacterium]